MRIQLVQFSAYAQKVTLYEYLGKQNLILKYAVMWENKEGLSQFPLYNVMWTDSEFIGNSG